MRMSLFVVLPAILLVGTPVSGQDNARRGIGVGGVTGAVIGGIIGNQNDETAEGVLIGGAVGAIAGGLMGKSQDAHERQTWHNYHAQQRLAAEKSHRAVSTTDVVQMTRNGVSDALIINQIQTHGVLQPLDVHEIVSLHQQGVHEPVISAMQRAPIASATTTHLPLRQVPVVVAPCHHSPVHVVHPMPYYPRYGHHHVHYGWRYR